MHRALDATMIVSQSQHVATATSITMKKVFASTNSANSTCVTMKSRFGQVIIKELANRAEVVAKHHVAAHTSRSNQLFKFTEATHHMGYSMSIHFVRKFGSTDIFFLVMAMAAPKSLATAGRFQFASSVIMRAAWLFFNLGIGSAALSTFWVYQLCPLSFVATRRFKGFVHCNRSRRTHSFLG
mmetsp:Transcript_2293/g.5366  ORF Transcript_2293/g.5366 Transcript_2293/m.5366 type:complete len:183 (-) Transcript_2293:121-669(-)